MKGQPAVVVRPIRPQVSPMQTACRIRCQTLGQPRLRLPADPQRGDPCADRHLGLSFGGYHAPRIAANDPPYALCAVMSANHVWRQRQRERVANDGANPVPHHWDHVMWVFGIDGQQAFIENADQITLDGQTEKIRVPFLITHGENHRQIPVYNAQMSCDQAVNSPKRTLRIFTKKTSKPSTAGQIMAPACATTSQIGTRRYLLNLVDIKSRMPGLSRLTSAQSPGNKFNRQCRQAPRISFQDTHRFRRSNPHGQDPTPLRRQTAPLRWKSSLH